MTCQEITNLISQIADENHALVLAIQKSILSQGKSKKETLEKLVTIYENKYPQIDKIFLSAFDSESLEKLQEQQIGSLSMPDNIVFKLGEHIAELTKLPPFNKLKYLQFIRRLKSFIAKQEITDKKIVSKLNSLFLNLFLDENAEINLKVDELPSILQAEFGLGLNCGKIKIDQLYCDRAFNRMQGGHVEVGQILGDITNSQIAYEMKGGRLIIGKTNVLAVAQILKSGTLSIGEIENGTFGDSAMGGTAFVGNIKITATAKVYDHILTAASGGTFIINNVDSPRKIQIDINKKAHATVLIKSARNKIIYNQPLQPHIYSDRIAYYDESSDKFRYLHKGYQIYDMEQDTMAYLTARPLENWIYRVKTQEFARRIQYNLLEGGILIMNNADTFEIGKGQKGGAIIINDPNLTYEEACKRVAPISERLGGIVLYLRKWKEKSPGIGGKIGMSKKRAEFVEIR